MRVYSLNIYVNLLWGLSSCRSPPELISQDYVSNGHASLMKHPLPHPEQCNSEWFHGQSCKLGPFYRCIARLSGLTCRCGAPTVHMCVDTCLDQPIVHWLSSSPPLLLLLLAPSPPLATMPRGRRHLLPTLPRGLGTNSSRRAHAASTPIPCCHCRCCSSCCCCRCDGPRQLKPAPAAPSSSSPSHT